MTATTDRRNRPSSFEWPAARALPAEFAQIGEAIDKFVKAMSPQLREHLPRMSQDQLADMVHDIALVLPYADCCQKCEDLPLVWPWTATVTKERLVGRYRCPKCRREWECGYALDLPWLFP